MAERTDRRRREPLGPVLLLAAVAAATGWAALTAWRGFVEAPGTYLRPLLVPALLLAATGALLRWLGTPRWATLLTQTLIAWVAVSQEVVGSLQPVSAAGALGQSLETAVQTSREYAAPIGDQVPPVWPLLVVAGAVVLLLVDTLACTYRRVPAAGLVLLAVYALPSGVLTDGPDVWSFVGAAAGFLVLLHLDSRDHLLRWGRRVGPEEDTLWRHGNPMREAMRAGAGRIAVGATALALVVPAFLPVVAVDVFELGAGRGDGDIKIRKPVTDMRRDLLRGRDVPLVTVETEDPAPSYLRISVLNRYTGEEWSSGDRNVARADVADGPLPLPPGVSDEVRRTSYDYQVSITDDFESTWLPTAFPAASVRAEGDWRFDPTTMDFLAAEDDLDTRGLSYRMSSLQLELDGTGRAFFRDARAGDVPAEALELPDSLPPVVRGLARSVTEGARSDYERAVLLQRWFRETGGFTYSLGRAPEGTGNETLEGFLAESGRVGYCEQFASAMAVMARALGIPARVAVGFLLPEEVGAGRWEYSSHDLHAWPEVYFAGSGWVRFEPTPAGRAENVPGYTRTSVRGASDNPTDDPSTAVPSPTAGATTAGPGARPTARPEIERDPGAAGDGADDGLSTPLLVGGIVLLVLSLAGGLVLLVPTATRARTRRTRLGGAPDDVWAELRDSAVDLGLPWPDGRSPREVGTMLLDHLAAPPSGTAAPAERPRTGASAAPEAADALERVVLAVELARYARPGTVLTQERAATGLATDGALIVAALDAGVTPRARRRARRLPRSVWRR